MKDFEDMKAIVRHALQSGWSSLQTREATGLTAEELFDLVEVVRDEAENDEG